MAPEAVLHRLDLRWRGKSHIPPAKNYKSSLIHHCDCPYPAAPFGVATATLSLARTLCRATICMPRPPNPMIDTATASRRHLNQVEQIVWSGGWQIGRGCGSVRQRHSQETGG
uniref:Uncharacterized protein n=1 Tax=Oryza brachyantha TaxID=4533 RepID=J3MEU5_ORYBR